MWWKRICRANLIEEMWLVGYGFMVMAATVSLYLNF